MNTEIVRDRIVNMIVNEIFYSLQGEGKLAGVPSIFIRLAGCPLRCRWCDTKYAWNANAGDALTPEQILEKIKEYPTQFAVITGGEPMVQAGLSELINILHENEYHITVETAGIEYLSGLPVDLMSISPKLLNSVPDTPALSEEHKQLFQNFSASRQLMTNYDYQLKFVVDVPNDLNEIADFLGLMKDVNPYKIYLMPQATTPKDYLEKSRWLADYCLQTGFALSPRLQVMLWPGQKGK